MNRRFLQRSFERRYENIDRRSPTKFQKGFVWMPWAFVSINIKQYFFFISVNFPKGLIFIRIHKEQNRESTEGYSRSKVEKRDTTSSGKLFSTIGASPKRDGTSTCACRTRWKCSIETTRTSVKVKLGIKVMKLAKSQIGWEVTVTGRGSECHLLSREGDFILLNKIPVSTIKLSEWRFQAFYEVSLFE